jgi:hypothetical protein
MKLLESDYCPKDCFWSGSGQDIREIILRAATTYCKMYATDIIYFFDHIQALDPDYIEVWFRDMGVDWHQAPDEWNYKLILEHVGDHYNLYEETKL